MLMNPDDPRVKKTRRGLREAFVRLILKKGYDAVSIQDIASEAETARITFYRHYKDKEELLTDCLNTLYEELAAKTERLTPEGLRNGISPILVLYEHIEEKEALYRILFSSRGTQTVIERVRHHIGQNALAALQDYVSDKPLAVPLDIIAYHIASAQFGMAMWWLDHDKPYPAQYMAQISIWLSLVGLRTALGISEAVLPPPEMP